LPWLWHPMVRVELPGDVSYFQPDMLVDRQLFEKENSQLAASGGALAQGKPANPIYLPAPHQVAIAFYQAFKTPPRLPSEPWLHESLGNSIRVIFWGFTLSSLIGLPLGILCGTFRAASRL